MVRLVVTRHVDAPPAAVFAVASDFANAPNVIPAITHMEVVTEGPVGKGTRFRETRKMFGREHTEEMEVTDFQTGKSYTLGAKSHGSEYITQMRFVPDGVGTRIELEFESKPVALAAKLMSPLAVLLKGTMQKCIEADLDAIKQRLEGQNQSTAAGA